MQNQKLPYKSEQREVAVEDVRNGHIAAFIGDYTQVQFYTQVSCKFAFLTNEMTRNRTWVSWRPWWATGSLKLNFWHLTIGEVGKGD